MSKTYLLAPACMFMLLQAVLEPDRLLSQVITREGLQIQFQTRTGRTLQTQILQRDFRLRTETVELARHETVKGALAARGVLPTSESITLVYELNPDIVSVDSVASGSTVVLPTAARSDLPQGYLASIELDADLKSQFQMRLGQLRLISGGLRARSGARSQWRVYRNDIRGISRRLRLLQTDRLPREALSQLNDLLADMIQTIQSDSLAISREQRLSLVNLWEREVDNKTRCSRNGINCLVPFAVRTMNHRDGRIEHRLRVFYRPMYLRTAPREFDCPTSPATRSLPVADYMLWAIRDGQLVSDTVTIQVRRCRRSEGCTQKVIQVR